MLKCFASHGAVAFANGETNLDPDTNFSHLQQRKLTHTLV